jgi:hypothetical protein
MLWLYFAFLNGERRVFFASKLEASDDRGKNDYLGSRDLEDVVAVVDGRQERVAEIKAAQGDVRSYLGKEIAKFAWCAGILGCTSGTSAAGLGEPGTNYNCHGKTKTNRSTSIAPSSRRVPRVYLGWANRMFVT